MTKKPPMTRDDVLKKIESRKAAMMKQRSDVMLRRIRKSKRARPTISITSTDICYLCDETRMLEKAHVIPLSLWADMDNRIEVPEPFLYVMHLCPTHHRCYDNYMLNDDELHKIRKITTGDSSIALEVLIAGASASPETDIRIVDRFINTIWKWWRSYYASPN